MTFVIVSYDISDDHNRLWISEKLKAHGLVRIQRSVFIGRGGYYRAKEIYRGTHRFIDLDSDSVFIIVVPGNSITRALIHGKLLADPLARSKYMVM